jgi:hypothetical protein
MLQEERLGLKESAADTVNALTDANNDLQSKLRLAEESSENATKQLAINEQKLVTALTEKV